MMKKKVLAVVLVATMINGTSMAALAGDLSSLPSNSTSIMTGDGQLEAYIDNEVTKVVVPTSAVTENFTLDPQGLLKVADSAKYSIGEGAVYFANGGSAEVTYAVGDSVTAVQGDNSVQDYSGATISDTQYYFTDAAGKKYVINAGAAGAYTLDETNDATVIGTAVKTAAVAATYSGESDAIQIINKSSFGIDVDLKVELKGYKNGAEAALTDIDLVTEAALATATEPSLYFAVKVGSEEKAILANDNKLEKSLASVPFVADAVNYVAGDVVYVATEPGSAITGAKGTAWFAESGDGHTVEHTVTAEDTGIVGEEKTAAVTEGYKISSYTDTAAATAAGAANITTGASGKVYGYGITSGYSDFSTQTLEFTLTGATNNVEGWGDVAETVKANITYVIEQTGAISYTDAVAQGNWDAANTLWLGKNASDGFDGETVLVEVSTDGGASYQTVTHGYNDNKWVSVTWTELETKGATGSEYTVRVTDGTTRYTYTPA